MFTEREKHEVWKDIITYEAGRVCLEKLTENDHKLKIGWNKASFTKNGGFFFARWRGVTDAVWKKAYSISCSNTDQEI